ncbi:hypothetical protein, partial [Roseovarius indicus]|uniref:hypothetical protein n=1 Tax=Roseovarius indicus TaxID=540747 RepID=UPI0032ED32C0
ENELENAHFPAPVFAQIPALPSPPATENSNFPTRNFQKFRPAPVAPDTTSRPLRTARHINHRAYRPRHRRDTDKIPT